MASSGKQSGDNFSLLFDTSAMQTLPDIDDLLNQETLMPFSSEHYSSPSNHSHSDHDTDSGFTSHPSMDDFCTFWEDDEDSHPRSPHGSELEHEHESHSEHETHVCHKKYRQPATLKATNLIIGPWKANDVMKPIEQQSSVELKFLFGRKKIKYEITQVNSKRSLLMDYDFSQISGVKFDPKERTIVFLLSEPPNFYAKERGKCIKVADFTQANASLYQRHQLELAGEFDEQVEKLYQSDRRLRLIAEAGLPSFEPTFANVDEKEVSIITTLCDWDKENPAVSFCTECNANHCEECDDVLHRNAARKSHKRLPIANNILKTKKNKKRKKSDRCRCGTGATKGTLGDPCTGNRCPCFSAGRSCVSCGCKNCNNPHKKNGNGGQNTSQIPTPMIANVITDFGTSSCV